MHAFIMLLLVFGIPVEGIRLLAIRTKDEKLLHALFKKRQQERVCKV